MNIPFEGNTWLSLTSDRCNAGNFQIFAFQNLKNNDCLNFIINEALHNGIKLDWDIHMEIWRKYCADQRRTRVRRRPNAVI